MHRTLAGQLERLGLRKDVPPDAEQWRKLLKRVSKAYGRAELKQESLENRFKAILLALPDALCLLDENGCYVEVLAGTRHLPLQPAEDIINKSLDQVFPAAQAASLLAAINTALDRGKPQPIEFELSTRDGPRHFEGQVAPTRILQNGLRTVVFLTRDVTRQVELNQRQRLLTTVINAAHEGVVIISQDKRVMYANPAVGDITGFPPDELMAEGEGFLRHELDQGLCKSICDEAHRGEHWQSEISMHNKSGENRAIWLSLDTIRNPGGEIEYFVALFTDVTDIQQSRADLEHVATHDALTNLPNRMLFQERMQQAVSRAHRQKARGALLLLDLDRFKQVNDSLGHSVGDELLIQVADRLQYASRMEDTVARFGGDEFIVVLEDLDSEMHAARVAEKILAVFEEPVTIGNLELTVSPSIGISVFPGDADSPDLLLQHADSAMYVAKAAGGGQFSFYTPDLSETALANISMQSALRQDMAAGVLEVVYQPQFKLETGDLVGMEVLVRWPQPDGSVRMPNDFIPMAEVSGLIEPLGMWVLREACDQAKHWQNIGLDFKCLSVNVSSRQLANPGFSEEVKTLLAGCDLAGGQLELEITESMVIQEGGVPHQNLDRLNDLDIKLAIDDFGTGHSSLVNLKRFPLSRLKIDQSFIRDVGRDPNDEAIVGATIALGKELAMEVVAEGVETIYQASFLEMLLCDSVQGHYYSRPMTAEEIERQFECLNRTLWE